jgi:hypothetical protein
MYMNDLPAFRITLEYESAPAHYAPIDQMECDQRHVLAQVLNGKSSGVRFMYGGDVRPLTRQLSFTVEDRRFDSSNLESICAQRLSRPKNPIFVRQVGVSSHRQFQYGFVPSDDNSYLMFWM